MNLGSESVSKIYLGSNEIQKIYLGDSLILDGSASYLLDTYTNSSLAYSLRQLSSSTTSVVRVRRDSDNTEQDFSAGDITDGTLTTFVGSGDGFVTTMYDQSGNGNDGINTNTTYQPKIVDSGSYLGYVDFSNGSLSPSSSVDSFGANSKMNFIDVVNIDYNSNAFKELHKWGTSSFRTYTSGGRIYAPGVNNQSWTGIQDNVWGIMNYSTNLGGIQDDGTPQVIVARINGASLTRANNDNRDHWDSSYRDFVALGKDSTSTTNANIHRKAFVIFNDDISDFNSLESDLNDIFNIY